MDIDDETRMRKQLGAAMRDRRTELGLTLGEVADAIGTSQSMVSDYERARSNVGLVRLSDWCAALDITPVEVIKNVYGLGTWRRGRLPDLPDGRNR